MPSREERFGIIFGEGRVAEYTRDKFPANLEGIDIRINPAASDQRKNGRALFTVDRIDLDRIIAVLNENHIGNVLFCGRPRLGGLTFNFGAHYFAANGFLGALKFSAPQVFRAIDYGLSQNNVAVRSILEFDDSTRLYSGFNGAVCSDLDLESIGREYFAKIPPYKPFKAIQALVGTTAKVIKFEGIGGTDEMLVNLVVPKEYLGTRLYFGKFPLKGCNPAYDLPVIGETTIPHMVKKGIKGVVIDPSVTVCMQRENVVRLCDDAGIFLYGVHTPLRQPDALSP